MGVSYKKGTFAKATTVTTQDITDVGFQPKALILWTSNQTVETYEEHMMISYGFSDGTTDAVIVTSSEDNVTTSDTYLNMHNDSIVMIINKTTGALEARATISTFLSNGFTVNWVTNTTPAAIIHYVAIGGTDITNVKVTAREVGTLDLGNVAYTGVGFQPDFLLIMAGPTGGLGAYSYDTTIDAGSSIILGAMKSTSERWTISGVSEDNQNTSDTWSSERHDRCWQLMTTSSGTLNSLADFVSFDADGFTWNFVDIDPTTSTNRAPLVYLAIKGGVWNVGNATMPAANSTLTTNTDASATLKGIMVYSMGNTSTTGTTPVANHRLTIGGSDGTNNGLVSYSDNDNSGLMVVTQIQNDNNCIMTHVANATATSSTTLQTAAASTFAAHSFDLVFTNTDGTARLMTYWAVSEAGGGGGEVVEEIPAKSFGTLGYNSDIIGNQTIFGGY